MKKRTKPAEPIAEQTEPTEPAPPPAPLYLVLQVITLTSEHNRLVPIGERVSLAHLEPAAIQKLIDGAVVRLDDGITQPPSNPEGE